MGDLQKVQNDALRVVTGCHAAASEQHLHEECKVLPVADHISMQCAQFLANTKTTRHPSSNVTNRPQGDRPTMKPTLQYAFNNRVLHHTNEAGIVPEIAYKKVLNTIHTETVAAERARCKPNRVLGYPPPEVHPSEATLPCTHQTTLNQLRSRWCKDLKSHQRLVRKSLDEDCPEWHMSAHTPQHLFSCLAAPSPPGVLDLWERPCEAATSLSSLPCFSHLPPLVPRPLPNPLPEPSPPGGRGL
jgi:hypothetical protein